MFSRRILAAVAVLCMLMPPAYAQKTKSQLNTEIGTNFPDNTVGQITPQNLRTVTGDIVNSILPTAPVTSGNVPTFNGTTGLLQDGGPLPGTGTVIYAVNYGVKCDGASDDTSAAQSAFTAAGGRTVVFPAGTCVISSSISISSSGPTFIQGPQVVGQGREKTIFDFRGANACLFNFQSSANGTFISGATFSNFKIINSTSTTSACGISIYRAAYAKFDNLQFTGLSGNGIFITASAGDPDASFEVVLDRVRMDNVGTGGAWCGQFNAPSGGYFGSNLRIVNSTFSGCGQASSSVPPTSGAINYKGLIAQFENDGFTINNNVDLYIQGPDTSLQVSIDGTDFENNISGVLPHVYVDGGLRGFHMVNSECLNNDFNVGQGCVWFNSALAPIGNVTLDKVEVRATTNNNSYTAFKATGSNTLTDTIRVSNIYWQTFDLTGQTRFSGLSFAGITGQAQFSINGVNSAILSGIGYGFAMPLHLAANGEWVEYIIPNAGITRTGIGGLSPSTAYYFYLYNSAATNAPYVGAIEVSSVSPISDTVSGYYVKNGDTTRTYIGSATTDGAGNFQTTSTQISQYPTGGGGIIGSGVAGQLARYVSPTTINGTTTGTGVLTALGVNTGSSGAFVVQNGALGSPSSAGTMPAFTLGGAITGGGQNITGLGTIASTAHTITSASASALVAGLNGATNPAFNVDASTALQVAGLNLKGAVTGGTVALSVTDSGSNANLSIDAKGTGSISIGANSTGPVTIGAGGTGAGINGKIILNGSNAANSGASMQFQRNATNLFQFGNSSGILGGTSNDFVIYSNNTGAGVTAALSVSDSGGGVFVGSHFGTTAPATKTANYSVGLTDNSLIFNCAGSCTLTLPAASSYTGRILRVLTIAAQTVVSASSNVVPSTGGAAGTAILAATAGKWADLQSNGTNWQIMAAN